ncbi:MAG: helix-turn-helix transcriptional regulator [Bacilli bacterium]|nr:helix-turn-helix domain-containing protein [Mollicutes bacterium]MDY3899468.1 helix-turn-helix transcriptional regulator [Bacilli bacterium]
MTFNEQLLQVRVQMNLTQTELANKLNVSFATISRWENGKVNPTKKALLTFQKFCRENKIVFEEAQQHE